MKSRVLLPVLLGLVVLFSLGVNAQELELTAKAALLMDARSGEVLYGNNIDEPLPIASITKLMTLTLVLEAVERNEIALTDLVDTTEYAASMGGSQVWLEYGEQLTLDEILYAIAVGSANDAAVAVAEFVAGSEATFVQQMNKRALELGLEQTIYTNASGLPPSLLGIPDGKQVMSAKDVANLSRFALSVPLLMDYVSTYEYTMRAETTKKPQLWNYNKLIRRYEGVDGFKTGFTTEAGHCLSVTAQRNDIRLIAVVLGSSSDANRESDITKLLDFGFREYTNHVIFTDGQIIDTLKFSKGEPLLVDAVLHGGFQVTVLRGEQPKITTRIEFYDQPKLPLDTNTIIGTITAHLDEKEIGQAALYSATEVKRAGITDLIIRTIQNMIDSLLGTS